VIASNADVRHATHSSPMRGEERVTSPDNACIQTKGLKGDRHAAGLRPLRRDSSRLRKKRAHVGKLAMHKTSNYSSRSLNAPIQVESKSSLV